MAQRKCVKTHAPQFGFLYSTMGQNILFQNIRPNQALVIVQVLSCLVFQAHKGRVEAHHFIIRRMEAGVDNFSLAFSCFDGVRNEIQFDIRIRAIATLITLKHQKEVSIINTQLSTKSASAER